MKVPSVTLRNILNGKERVLPPSFSLYARWNAFGTAGAPAAILDNKVTKSTESLLGARGPDILEHLTP